MAATLGKNSPYSASFTALALGFFEMESVLPTLMDSAIEDKSAVLTRDDTILPLPTENSRQRVSAELLKRYNAVDISFWQHYTTLQEPAKRVALFYVFLKTYKIAFDFQINVILDRWNSVDQTVQVSDILFQISEIAASDAFVDSWSDATKRKVATKYLATLREAGMLAPNSDVLRPVQLDDRDYAYYLTLGESWFLQACLLQPYQIQSIKEALR